MSHYDLVDARPVKEAEGQAGNMYCTWCQAPDLKLGFGMCFQHFCICPDCVERGLDDFARPGPMPLAECFCCTTTKRKLLPKEERKEALLAVPVYITTETSFDICLDCLHLAQTLLYKRQLTVTEQPEPAVEGA